jgi:hypothetical protein
MGASRGGGGRTTEGIGLYILCPTMAALKVLDGIALSHNTCSRLSSFVRFVTFVLSGLLGTGSSNQALECPSSWRSQCVVSPYAEFARSHQVNSKQR